MDRRGGALARHVRALATWLILALASVSVVSACAEDVGDIDRTQPNKLKKSDLAGTWYMLETVTHVPSTSRATFEGETSKLEKIVWKVEENLLLAYRAYPLVPGADDVDVDGIEPSGYADDGTPIYGEAVAAFPIVRHFDIRREYNPATGEQTNILIENDYDRPWYEREYIRVDWAHNQVTNLDFISGWFWQPVEASYSIDEEREHARSRYFERDAESNTLVAFDLPNRLLLQPDWYGCIISLPWYGWDTQDCAPAEVEIVTSFARTEPVRDYEPLTYDDQNMSRFGYFRSERYVHDPQRGVLESTRQELINRHNIWAQSYRRDERGEFLRDDQGRLVPIPLSERPVRAVPYYLSQTFPADELIRQAARDVMAQWDTVGREAVAAARGVSVDQVTERVFTLCNNPVAEGDDPACGPVGRVVRPGDLRYSTLHWVESSQLEGPLGYGPSAADPETGEIISGRAYVYGEGISTYAAYGLDIIRFINGDLDPKLLANLEHVRAEVTVRATEATAPRQSERLREIPLGSRRMRDTVRLAERMQRRKRLERFDRHVVTAQMERARSAGLGRMLGGGGDEYLGAVAARLGKPRTQLSAVDLEKTDPTRWMNPTFVKEFQRQRLGAMARAVDYVDMLDANVLGIAKQYQGRTDYEQIWRELRAEVFRATALHEVGHTVGLRHNFQASYDSLNYHDEYWQLRTETLFAPQSMGDLYTLNAQTQAQIDGRMRDYRYSSIMDYGYTFNSDFQGLGRYDRAALVYGYTGGSEVRPDDACVGHDRARGPSGECLVRELGFVEVFDKTRGELGEAGRILTSRDEQGLRFDDPTTPIVPYLERWHYTTFMQSFPQLEDAFARRWMRIGDYRAQQGSGDGERVRVPYLFCSDEWAGGLLSCQVFDAGSDPFEMTQTLIDGYRSYYYFNNFKRDRLGWDPFMTLFREFFYTFLPLSDYYQNWYLSPDGYDPVMDDYWWISIHAGLNLIAEALATPPYGTFCMRPNGELFNLGEEAGLNPTTSSEFYRVTYCDNDQPYVEVAQGQGRRHWTAYDFDAGYNFADQPLEAGHYWTTLAAFWALIDPEAFVLGTDADAGVFAISYYDFFAEEVDKLVNAVTTENYAAYSPVIEITDTSGENLRGRLVHQPLTRLYDSQTRSFFDPETGASLDTLLGPSRATTALCEPCERHDQCNGYTGALGGVFCFPIDDSGVRYCTQDCYEDASLCGADQTCDPYGTCVPLSGTCVGEVKACSPSAPQGRCPEGQNCVDGSCQDLWPIVETDATFALVDDMMFYGMLYSTFGYSTRYNDQINVFRKGTNEEITPGPGFSQVTFTDPVSGFAYGAIVEACADQPQGGSRGMCQLCNTHSECGGYTGDFGGAFCVPIGPNTFCLQDCTNDPGICAPGFTCNVDGNCMPDDNRCQPEDVTACSPASPFGACDAGLTCVGGACVSQASPRCVFDLGTVAGGAQMVMRGEELVAEYNRTLEAYWNDDATDPQRELELYWHHARARFELETHIDKISDIRAVFNIFGRLY